MENRVRIAIDRKLSEEEIGQILDIIDDHAYVEEDPVTEDGFDVGGDVNVCVSELEGEYFYDIPIVDPVSQLDARFMAEKVADFIPDDFELGATYES